MATITGLTAARMLLIEGASVISGLVNGSGDLILTKHNGTTINAGNVKGPKGDQGDPGVLTGVAGGDLTGSYPNPTIGPLKVLTAAIANLAVTNGKLAANAVTTAKIQDAQVTKAKLAADALPGAMVQLTPTMSGVSGHAMYIKETSPGTICVSGYMDVDDAVLTRRFTGMTIPVGMRPPSQVIVASPVVGSNANYRYFFNVDGTIEFEQDTANNGPFEAIQAFWFTA